MDEFETGFSNEGGGGVSPDLPDMDSLFEQSVNMDDVRQVQSDILKPAGSYVTQPDLSVQTSVVGEGPNKGRRLIRFFGAATLTVTERTSQRLKLPPGSVVPGTFGFAMSPERANKVRDSEDTGKPDLASQLWAQAVTAYQQVYRTKPTQVGDVVRYVQSIPVVLRVIQVGVPTERNPEPDGEPGNIVMALSPVREGRG